MRIIRNLPISKNQNLPELVLTIGNFDGVHLGHKKIIEEVKKVSKTQNIPSAILTFEPHPARFFRPQQSDNFRITSLAQKLRIFSELGIDYAIILPFTQRLAEISAQNFVREILVQHLNTKHLIVGYDFIFGKNREGNFQLLEELSKELGFGLVKIEAESSDQDCGEIYSSSLVRKLISEGKVSEANSILGRNFLITGIVNQGKKLGAQIGFPTMNLRVRSGVIKPKFGVYKTSTFIPHLNKKFASITNFGIRPTISDEKLPVFETHISGFSEKIYGKKISVEFLDFIREEKKFLSLDELKAQIAKDLAGINA